MAFIGNTNTTQAFTPAVDFFNGNGSTTAFTLSKPVASVAQVQAVISNVPQNPGDAFTVSGNTITFTSAPPSGTQNIYVYYTSPITQVITPGQGTVGSDQLQSSINITTLSTTNGATVQGLTVGKGAGAVATNTAVGASALASGSQTGIQTTAVGANALAVNTSGNYSVAVGFDALAANTTGANNTAVGRRALYSNTTASGNHAFGFNALFSNTTGANNTALGDSALTSNGTASNNTAVGYQAGYSNTTGQQLTAIGVNAGRSNTTGADNSFIGYSAGYSNSTGSYNTVLGKEALAYNTTSNFNTCVGYQAGYTNTGATNAYFGAYAGTLATGAGNTFIGTSAGEAVTTGAKNTILGRYNGNNGGLDIRTSSNNVVLSDGDGNAFYRTAGSLLHLGADLTTGLNGFGGENVTKINYYMGSGGFFAINSAAPNGNACMYVSLSSSATTSTLINFAKSGSGVGYISTNGSSTAYNTSSDYRLKENIAPMTGALAKVAALKPCTYTWKSDGSAGEGFIAHELANVVPDAVTGEKDATRIEQYEISPAVPATFDDEGNELTPAVEAVIGEREVPVYQGIDTSFLVATLTAAIQELKAEFDAYKEAHP